jgi:hypothetical protein
LPARLLSVNSKPWSGQ